VRSFAHGFDISLKGHAALSCFAYYELHTDNPIDRGSAHDSDTRELQGLLAAAVRSIYDRETFVEFAHAMPLGLECVALTNATAIGKGKTVRVKGRKSLRKNCLGFYHPKSKREQAWIEILVDNIVASFPLQVCRGWCGAPLFFGRCDLRRRSFMKLAIT
jgi:hypothetical protein